MKVKSCIFDAYEQGIISKEIYEQLREKKCDSGENFLQMISCLKGVDEDKIYSYVSKKFGYKLLEYNELKKQILIPRYFPYSFLRKKSIIPTKLGKKEYGFAVANPLEKGLKDEIREELGINKKIKFSLAKKRDIDKVLSDNFMKVNSLRSMNEKMVYKPDECSHQVLTPSQRIIFVLSIVILIIWVLSDYPSSFIVVFAAINLFYFLINPIKFYVLLRGVRENGLIKVSEREIHALQEDKLPVYTILVPLYKEASVLPKLIKHINAIDYPVEKLDVKVLLEEDDNETIEKAKEIGILEEDNTTNTNEFPGFDVIIVPDAPIKTKPRACNYGFLKSRGEYVVIYDAEDKPDPNQLKKAVVAFEKTGKKTICVQAKLNFFNDKENMLTKWFSIEYLAWFDYYLPNLKSLDAPIPLGGTSNHFKAEYLDNLGFWDPYNVTEDAELGLRIYRTQLETQVMDSITLEEANNNIFNWIRQRSRWQKGYLQTYLLIMRRPIKSIRENGLKKFILLHLTFGSNTIVPLINPFLWVTTIVFFIYPQIIPIFPLAVVLISLFNLFIANTFYILFHFYAVHESKKRHLIFSTLLIPLYWMLLSVGAWKGLIQLLTKPFYWEKTIHGITKESDLNE